MTISVEKLSFSYQKDIPVLTNISFSIPKGQFIGVFGPNGGGKTTLLKILLGLIKPSTGSVKILDTSPHQAQAKMGYVPQMRHFDPQFPITVMEVVLQGCLAIYRGWGPYSTTAKDRAFDALKKMGLEEKAKARFGALSGGQMQRVLIARALASQPEILLLDEATVGVDPESLKNLFQLLLELRGEITILLVTHDLQAIAKQMDGLLCINQQLTPYSPQQVCEHFAMGLYHPLLIKKEGEHGSD